MDEVNQFESDSITLPDEGQAILSTNSKTGSFSKQVQEEIKIDEVEISNPLASF